MEQWEVADQQRNEAVTAAAADEGWTVVTRQRVRLLLASLHESPGTELRVSPCGRLTSLILLTFLYIVPPCRSDSQLNALTVFAALCQVLCHQTSETYVKFHDMQALQAFSHSFECPDGSIVLADRVCAIALAQILRVYMPCRGERRVQIRVAQQWELWHLLLQLLPTLERHPSNL